MDNLVRVDKLENGMMLERDVLNENTGIVLVGKDMYVTDNLKKRLIENGIKKVYIKKESVTKEKYNEALVKNYRKVEKGLEDIFTSIEKGEKLSPEEILEDMTGFIKEVVDERDILTQLRLLKKKDDYTFNHSIAVGTLAVSLGKWLGYSEEKITEIGIAGMFHDLGKLQISKEIINKPGKLTEEEFEIMKKHSLYSSEILIESGNFNEDIIAGALEHHESMNGTGYPHGKSGDEIHPYAKIISICDIYHALTSNRAYKDRESPLKVADYLREESFTVLDPYMTRVFLKNVSKFYVGNKVLLSTDEIGEIIYVYPQESNKTIVKVGDRFIDFSKEKDIEILDILI